MKSISVTKLDFNHIDTAGNIKYDESTVTIDPNDIGEIVITPKLGSTEIIFSDGHFIQVKEEAALVRELIRAAQPDGICEEEE